MECAWGKGEREGRGGKKGEEGKGEIRDIAGKKKKEGNE